MLLIVFEVMVKYLVGRIEIKFNIVTILKKIYVFDLIGIESFFSGENTVESIRQVEINVVL